MIPPSSRRLFFAIWPDAPARELLRSLAHDVAKRRDGRAPREDNLHVTLAFLGTVAASRIALLESIGAGCARRCASFDLSLDALGGTSHGIAWLAPRIVPAPLASLHEALTAALAGGGFTVEQRRFRPHVTLARNCTKPPRRGAVAPIGWRVNRFSLVASTPTARGSLYSEVSTWPLASRASG